MKWDQDRELHRETERVQLHHRGDLHRDQEAIQLHQGEEKTQFPMCQRTIEAS